MLEGQVGGEGDVRRREGLDLLDLARLACRFQDKEVVDRETVGVLDGERSDTGGASAVRVVRSAMLDGLKVCRSRRALDIKWI
jgi:hypothetical protein